MIADPVALSEVGQQWAAVQELMKWRRSVMLSGIFYTETPPDTFYNLPLVLAYSALDAILTQMIIEGLFSCKGRCFKLGEKMNASKKQIKWIDYSLVDKGRDERNSLAHKATLVSKNDCIKYIKAIEIQISAWGIRA